jgi:hypothetical protein
LFIEVEKWATRSILRASFITQIRKYETAFLSVQRSTVRMHYKLVYSCMSSELISRRTYMPCNKKLTDFDCSGCTGKYQTSVSRYRSVNTAHSRTPAWYLPSQASLSITNLLQYYYPHPIYPSSAPLAQTFLEYLGRGQYR